MPIWKSTIIVYSPFDPSNLELSDLAVDAEGGRSYSPFYTPEIIDPNTEPDFPHEFFADQYMDDDALAEAAENARDLAASGGDRS